MTPIVRGRGKVYIAPTPSLGEVLDAPPLARPDPWTQALREVFGDTTPTLSAEELQAQRDGVLAQTPRLSLADFVRGGWDVLEPGTPFEPNWHVEAICAHLEAVTDSRIRRLLINIPPGHMKSLLVSVVWPAWVWTFRPEWRGLFSSYAKDLAIRDSVKCRALIESDWYQETFAPTWSLAGDQNVKSYFVNTRQGFRLSISVGGQATGYRGDCVVVDDPLNVADQHSEAAPLGAIFWWDKSMNSRLNDQRTGARVIVMQRLHDQDLSGHVLRKGGANPYVHLCLPTEFEPARRSRTSIGWEDPREEEGELLFPTMFPLEVIDEAKLDLGSDGFAGQHQQRPVVAEGGHFKRTWWRFWTEPPPKIQELVRSVDCSFKDTDGTDYVAFGVWARMAADLYLLDRLKARLDFVGTLKAFRAICEKWPKLGAKFVEDKANGPAVISALRREIPGIIAIDPEGGKVARAAAASPIVEAGNVWLPGPEHAQRIAREWRRVAEVKGSWLDPRYVRGWITQNDALGPLVEWVSDYIEEHAAFPKGVNDDEVDQTTQVIIRLYRSSPGSGQRKQAGAASIVTGASEY